MGGAPYFEVLEGSTASANLQALITFTIPTDGVPVRLLELGLLPDSLFQSYGTFQLLVNGQTRMTTPQRLRNSLNVPFWSFSEKVVLNPGDKVEIKGKSDGTNTVLLSASLLGEVLA